tara:strand:- start:3298 stop:3519 length:222 start_codon:yes stop_codon:yes gene_type:complete
MCHFKFVMEAAEVGHCFERARPSVRVLFCKVSNSLWCRRTLHEVSQNLKKWQSVVIAELVEQVRVGEALLPKA